MGHWYCKFCEIDVGIFARFDKDKDRPVISRQQKTNEH